MTRDGFFNAAMSSLAVMIMLWVGVDIGILCWCRINFAVAHALLPPLLGMKNF